MSSERAGIAKALLAGVVMASALTGLACGGDSGTGNGEGTATTANTATGGTTAATPSTTGAAGGG
ncbi:MAG: hypothetical protein RL385_4881, partial [Pseudomonadota bacterium]